MCLLLFAWFVLLYICFSALHCFWRSQWRSDCCLIFVACIVLFVVDCWVLLAAWHCHFLLIVFTGYEYKTCLTCVKFVCECDFGVWHFEFVKLRDRIFNLNWSFVSLVEIRRICTTAQLFEFACKLLVNCWLIVHHKDYVLGLIWFAKLENLDCTVSTCWFYDLARHFWTCYNFCTQ